MAGENAKNGGRIGPLRAWALAAGGMVGGGIYVALGVVIQAAGKWAWLSFLLAGVAAVFTAFSYARLSNHFGQGGGAFEFLELMKREEWAGSLSWLLIVGYTLTIAVYSNAFGQYVSHGVGGGELVRQVLAACIVVAMVLLNLAGAGKLTGVEVVIVSVNLLILLVLGVVGLADFHPEQLSQGIEPRPWYAAISGAAAIFVAYEGFQLLAYEYDELKEPKRYFVPVLLSASIFVVGCYVAVCLGATSIAGAGAIVATKEVSLAEAARKVGGNAGLYAMTLAAAFATSAAINSTLFSTAKLAARVADDRELPPAFAHRNRNDIPDRSVWLIGLSAGALSVFGSLSELVEAASLLFVATFGFVNYLCARETSKYRWPGAVGAVLCLAIAVVLTVHLADTTPVPLVALLVMLVAAVYVRPWLLKRRA